jgi:hypothetical protein
MAKTPRRPKHGIELLPNAKRAVGPADAGRQLLEIGRLRQASQLSPARASGDAIGVHVSGDQREVGVRSSQGIIENPGQLGVSVRDAKNVEVDRIKSESQLP